MCGAVKAGTASVFVFQNLLENKDHDQAQDQCKFNSKLKRVFGSQIHFIDKYVHVSNVDFSK